jgi:hypothetical protein
MIIQKRWLMILFRKMSNIAYGAVIGVAIVLGGDGGCPKGNIFELNYKFIGTGIVIGGLIGLAYE